ncbi:hypothetical protein [Jeongeupia chitinilytica]|uniref:Lipoprotein n=1 Tax=Jeongeupia chitinilytica TaxID=1041641 RepID=A0ABQ3GX99_9NEIS|nr:hypothetical protein [Jeongeupia chitinilytica]GHD59569.1 hypothetical protein GCM10007350_11240 [Jeongeupia chitinilytica]
MSRRLIPLVLIAALNGCASARYADGKSSTWAIGDGSCAIVRADGVTVSACGRTNEEGEPDANAELRTAAGPDRLRHRHDE